MGDQNKLQNNAGQDQTLSSAMRPASKGTLLANATASTCNCPAGLADSSTIKLATTTITASAAPAPAPATNQPGGANQMPQQQQQQKQQQQQQKQCCSCPSSSVDNSVQPSQKQLEKELPGGKQKATVPIHIIVEPRSDDSVRCDCRNCQFFSGWCCMPCALLIIIVVIVFWLTTKFSGVGSHDQKDLNKTIANATKGALASLMKSSPSLFDADADSGKLDEIETID